MAAHRPAHADEAVVVDEQRGQPVLVGELADPAAAGEEQRLAPDLGARSDGGTLHLDPKKHIKKIDVTFQKSDGKGNGVEPLVAGGRYDGLMTQLGAATPIPAVGFSVWIEALTQLGRKPAATGSRGCAS